MGVSYRAITIIGCEIDVTKLYEYTETYDAGHGCPAFQKMLKRGDRVEFCSTCGAELLKSGRRCKAPEYEEEDTLGGFEVVTAVDRTFLVAWSQENDEDGSGGATRASTSGLFLSDARERVRTILEPLGMWNDASYGIWTILHVG